MGRISRIAFFAVLALPLTASADPAEDYAHLGAAQQVQAGIYAERANLIEKLPAADVAKAYARSGQNPDVARAALVKQYRADAAALTKQGAAAGGRTDVLRSIALVHRSAGARMTIAELQQTANLETLEQQGLSSNIAYFN